MQLELHESLQALRRNSTLRIKIEVFELNIVIIFEELNHARF